MGREKGRWKTEQRFVGSDGGGRLAVLLPRLFCFGDGRRSKAREREKEKWKEREICMSQEQLLSDSLRRFGEGSPMFSVVLCGDVVHQLFVRSACSAEMK